MRTYTYTTTVSPMDDGDLAANFVKARRRYWIRRGLWIPDDYVVRFGKIKRNPKVSGKQRLMAYCDYEEKSITIVSEMRWMYFAVHISLLHEMAHLYVAHATNFDGRKGKHGKTFADEIDRLYALGAFRHLI